MTWDLTAAAVKEGPASSAIDAWSALVRAVRSESPGNRLSEARAAVASVLLPSVGGSVASTAAVHFAEQMAADVSAVTDEQRGAALADLAASALPFVQAVWVCDIGTRARAALAELFGEEVLDDAMSDGRSEGEPAGPAWPAWPAQEEFLRQVAKLTALDPVTSELVRLRGARAHRCRLCQSLRSRMAVRAAGGSGLFDVEDSPSELTERHQVAVRFVDAFIWQPMAWPAGLAGAVRDCFSPDEAVELVLDVMRNSANKIAVAFAADAPHVDTGVEYYDIDFTTGELLYGLSPE